MKTRLLNTIVLWVMLVAIAHAQDFQGEAVYESKTRIDFNLEGRNIPEDRKKMIEERMKQMGQHTYILTFNRNESTYKEDQTLGTPGGGDGGMRFNMMGSFTSGDYYKNVSEGVYYDQREMFGKIFLIKDSLPKLEWVMGSETKQIGNYTCFKATAMMKAPEVAVGRFGPPRPGQEEEEKAEEERPDVEVTAWYTPEIPVNQGPGSYYGLPGLILEVSDGRTVILCSKLTLNAKDKKEIKAPGKGKEVTQEEYDEILKEKMEEMRENFRNRRPGGRRN